MEDRSKKRPGRVREPSWALLGDLSAQRAAKVRLRGRFGSPKGRPGGSQREAGRGQERPKSLPRAFFWVSFSMSMLRMLFHRFVHDFVSILGWFLESKTEPGGDPTRERQKCKKVAKVLYCRAKSRVRPFEKRSKIQENREQKRYQK